MTAWAPVEPTAGSELAGYRIEAPLGRGGSGVVFRAHDVRLDRPVALKLLAPELAADGRFRDRFLRESRLAASIDHPNIVPIYDAGEAGGHLFLAMRYVEGTDLAGLLRRQGALDPARAARIAEGVAGALDAAHERGLVHGDVKPANILLAEHPDRPDHVYLADFGLARSDGDGDGGGFQGTVLYAAPEQIEGPGAGARTDVYALGCVLFECLTGEPPFRHDSMIATLWAHLYEDPPPVSRSRPGPPALSERLDMAIARALSKPVEERTPTCMELVGDVQAALAAPAPPRPVSPRRPAAAGRRTVTVLVAELRSARAATDDARAREQARAALRAQLAALAAEVEAHGGWVERELRGVLIAMFGAPVAHDDDPHRAVAAALAMRERARAAGPAGDEQPELRIGIDTGDVLVEPGEGGDVVVEGDAVDSAARLQELATPGRILTGAGTFQATRRAYAFRAGARTRGLGRAERTPSYEALGPVDDAGAGITSPVVGRDRELEVLAARVRAAAAGEGALVVITGEAGVGKSRLLLESRPAANDAGLLVLAARTQSYGRTLAYRPFVDLLGQLAGIDERDGQADRFAALERRLAALFPGAAEDVLPYLATLLALPLPEPLGERLRVVDAEAVGRQIFRAVRRVFERLATRQPLAVVLEDWHWADDDSAALLEHLLPLVGRVPIAIVCTARPEPGGPPERLLARARADCPDRVTELSLAPLPADAAERLVANLAGGTLPPGLAAQLFETTEGNPFFLEELVRGLLEAQALVPGQLAGTLDAERASELIVVPATLRGAITARVDRLDAGAQEVLRIAAVAGRSFSEAILHELADPGLKPDRQLEELVRAGLLREREGATDARYAFRHAVTHDVVYEGIVPERRRDLHARVAAAIERRRDDRHAELSALLAYHYAQADDPARAHELLLRAGDQAASIAANSEALDHYRRAIDAYELAYGADWPPLERAELDLKMGEAFWRRGQHEQALEYLTRGIGALGVSLPESRRGVRIAIAGQLARQGSHRLLRAHRLRRPATPPAEAEAVSQAMNPLGWIHYFFDGERLVLDALLQLNLSEHNGIPLGIVRGTSTLGFILDAVPARRLAGRYHERAVDLADRLESPAASALAHLGLAHHRHHVLGRWDEALASYGVAALAATRAADLRSWGAATLMIASLRLRRGDLRGSLEAARAIEELAGEAGDTQVLAWGKLGVSQGLLAAGRVETARASLEEGNRLARAVPDHQVTVTTGALLARCDLEEGDTEAALVRFEACVVEVVRHKVRGFHATELHAGLTAARLDAADQAGGAPRNLGLARHACRALRRQARLDTEALPAALRLAGTCAWIGGKPGAAQRRWRRSLAAAEALGSRYDAALTLLEQGGHSGDASSSERGRALLAEIRSGVA